MDTAKMHRLRSQQHFVVSPRRISSPLKHKTSHSRLHIAKRRRVGANGAGGDLKGATSALATEVLSSPDSDDEVEAESDHMEEPSSGSTRSASSSKRSEGVPLDSQAGSQRANRRTVSAQVRGKARAGGVATVLNDVFGEEGSVSPRKRKRGSAVTTPQHVSPSPGRSGSDTGDSGSWIEVDDGEDEPDLIPESDQYLIAEASSGALHRLKKAQLIELWKKAGLWDDDAENGIVDGQSLASGDMADGDETEEVREAREAKEAAVVKKDLVDGLIAARSTASSTRFISPLPSPRASPRRKGTLEGAPEIKRLRSASSLAMRSVSSSSSNGELNGQDPDVTPKANLRTRTNARVRLLADGTPMRTLPRRRDREGKSEKRHGARRKSMHEHGLAQERRARFGDEVKSPAHGLLRRPRRVSSSASSTYTTTDTSPPAGPSRATPKRLTRRRPSRSQPDQDLGDDDEQDDDVQPDDLEGADDDPTPLIARLRSRTKSFQEPAPSEVDADDEEDDIEEAGPSRSQARRNNQGDDSMNASPIPSRSTRSRDRTALDEDEDIRDIVVDERKLLRRDSRLLPRRKARRKALAAIKANGAESTDSDGALFEEEVVAEPDEDEGMDVDQEDSLTRRRRSTRSAPESPSASQASSKSSRRMSRRASGRVVSSSGSDLTPGPPSTSTGMDVDDDGSSRTTRSGRAFGTMQSRSDRLRQEAMDDPDMEVDEDDDESDEAIEEGYDLSEATVGSLTKLLREELVRLCEAKGIEVGGTKPQLAQALLDWRDEQNPPRSASSTPTARPSRTSSRKSNKSDKLEHLHAVASHKHIPGDKTPVLLRSHVHGHDPATPHASPKAEKQDMDTARPKSPTDTSKRTTNEADLNFDLAELGLEDSMIKPEQLTKLEKIGSGGFKDVYVGKLRGRKVAISEFREHLSEMDIRELKLLAEFSHPNIVKFKGICIPEDSSQIPCMLVSELCENGDLFDYIRNVEKPPLKRVLNLMLDIARGLDYLHTRNPAIIHRDCKSSNILINRAGQAKVGDFGLARVKHSTRSMIRSLVGTVNWQAPELWHPSPRYDYKVDVFSAGVVFWEMMSGWGTGEQKYPWEGHNEHYIYDAVGQKLRRPSVTGLRKIWGAEPVNLMERMWHQDAGDRPTMSDVVADLEAIIAGVGNE